MQQLDWFGNHQSFHAGSSAALHWRQCWGYYTGKSPVASVSHVSHQSSLISSVSSSGGSSASSFLSPHLRTQPPAESDCKQDLSEVQTSLLGRDQCGACCVSLSRSQCSLCVSLALHTSHYCSQCEQVAFSTNEADAYSSAGYFPRQSWFQDDSGWWSWSHDRGRWA